MFAIEGDLAVVEHDEAVVDELVEVLRGPLLASRAGITGGDGVRGH
jgi:hypothetical protein